MRDDGFSRFVRKSFESVNRQVAVVLCQCPRRRWRRVSLHRPDVGDSCVAPMPMAVPSEMVFKPFSQTTPQRLSAVMVAWESVRVVIPLSESACFCSREAHEQCIRHLFHTVERDFVVVLAQRGGGSGVETAWSTRRAIGASSHFATQTFHSLI